MSLAKPGSSCISCGVRLRPCEIIPVFSYIVLGGHCRSCGARISPRYILTELITGLVWCAAFIRFGVSAEFPGYAVLLSVLIAVFFIDIEWMRIPNVLVIAAMFPAIFLFVRFSFLLDSPGERFQSAYRSALPFEPLLGLVPFAFFAVVYVITALIGKGKSAIGMGDVKLLVPVGLSLGFYGAVFAMFSSVILGGTAGIILLATKIKNRKDPIPFGPFIVVGVAAAILFPIR